MQKTTKNLIADSTVRMAAAGTERRVNSMITAPYNKLLQPKKERFRKMNFLIFKYGILFAGNSPPPCLARYFYFRGGGLFRSNSTVPIFI